MNRLPPVNPYKVVTQCLFFVLFCAGLWNLLQVSDNIKAYKEACSRIESQQRQLNQMNQSLKRYQQFRKRYLPCTTPPYRLVWQHMKINFQDVDLATLLKRIDQLYSNRDDPLNGQGIFFMDRFRFVRQKQSSDEKSGHQRTDGGTRRIFTIEGHMLTPCSTR